MPPPPADAGMEENGEDLRRFAMSKTAGGNEDDDELLNTPMEASGANKRGRKEWESSGSNGSTSEGARAISELWKKMDALEEVTLAVGALTLENAAQNREEKGYSLLSALVDPEWDWVKAGLQEAKTYQETVRARRGKDVGPPHIRITQKILIAIIKTKGKDPADHTAMKAWWDMHMAEGKSLIEYGYEIQHMQIKKPNISRSKKWKDGTKEYVTIKWRFRSDFHLTFAKFLTNSGATMLVGTAPRQFNERDAREKMISNLGWGKEKDWSKERDTTDHFG